MMTQRLPTILSALLFLSAYHYASAQEPSQRDAAIAKLTAFQAQSAGALLDDRLLDLVLARFRKVNPGASEEAWRQIKSDVRAAFLRALLDTGSPFAMSSQEALAQFTTEEIERLVTIQADPLVRRYTEAAQAAMNKPQAQLAMRVAIERSVVEINDALKKRGLKPAY